MRQSKFTESQIMAILGEGEVGLPVAEVCRNHGISNVTHDQWTSKRRVLDKSTSMGTLLEKLEKTKASASLMMLLH